MSERQKDGVVLGVSRRRAAREEKRKMRGGFSSATGDDEDGAFKVQCACNTSKISELIESFNEQKCSLVRSVGFGAILKIPKIGSLNRRFCMWLMSKLDSTTTCLELSDGVCLPLRDVDVHLVLGIPFRGEAVVHSTAQSDTAIGIVKDLLFSCNPGGSLTVGFLEQILKKDYGGVLNEAECIAFKVAFVLYTMAYFLAVQPPFDRFPTWLVSNFSDPSKLSSFNWSRYVWKILAESAKNVQQQLSSGSKSIMMFGRTLLLHPMHLVLPRASIYSPALLSNLSRRDCIGESSTGFVEYGTQKLRDEKFVCYSRAWRNNEADGNDGSNVGGNLSELLRTSLNLCDNFRSHLSGLLGENVQLSSGNLQSIIETFDDVREAVGVAYERVSIRSARDIRTLFIRLYPDLVPRGNSGFSNMSNKRKVAEIGDCDGSEVDRIIHAKKKTGSLKNKSGCKLLKAVLFKNALVQLSDHSASSSNALQNSTGTSSHSADVMHNNLVGKEQVSSYSASEGSSTMIQENSGGNTGVFTSSNEEAEVAAHMDHHSSGPVSLEAIDNQKKIVTSHSNFGQSPFELWIDHPDVPRKTHMGVSKWLKERFFPPDQLALPWIKYDAPSPVSISGHALRSIFADNGRFTIDVVDAIMLLYVKFDDWMYSVFLADDVHENRWRHFLGARFAYDVLHGFDYLESDAIRSFFLGDHITYDVEHCQMLVFLGF
ncbi:hypothetical protein ACP4OV_004255 [Aristida adscensionis]